MCIRDRKIRAKCGGLIPASFASSACVSAGASGAQFINSNFAMLNGRLAYFYGIPGVSGYEFRPVARTNARVFRR